MARGAPIAASRRPLRIHVLGGLAVEGFDEHALGSRKARSALRTLAFARGTPVTVDRLADALWDEEQPKDPAAQVAVIVSRLRAVLGTERITHGDGGYTLHCDWLDLTSVEELAGEAEHRLRSGAAPTALAAARAARDMLGRPGSVDDVSPPEHQPALERLARRVRRLVARAALAAGELGTAVEAAEEALQADPYDEESLRLAMAGLAAAGQQGSALALHERMRVRLQDDLGTSPSPETDAVHRALLKGLPAPGITVRTPGGARRGARLSGRDGELQRLDALFAQAAAGTTVTVVVEGEPGIGKTALVDAWLEQLGPAVQVLSTRCDQLSRALPLQPVLQLLRTALRRAGADATATLLAGDGPLLTPLLDYSGMEQDAAEAATATSPAGTALLCAALRRVLTRLCTVPSVLFVDDVHRADAVSLGFLADLATATGLPLLLLLTQRSGAAGELPGERLVLQPLSRDDAATLVGESRADDLHRRTGGSPLFLSLLAPLEDPQALPDTVQHAVNARLAEAPLAATTLCSAAVLGATVDVDLLAGVTRGDPLRLLDDLDTGVRLAILEERDGAYAFRHAVLREALEAATPAPRRALLHREAARALMAQPGADPMLIAHHARRSGARAIAAAALTTASRIAADRFDHDTALALAGEAIAAEDTSAARLQRAVVLLRQARYDEARGDADLAVQRGDDGAAWEVAGAVAYYCRDFPRAAALGEALQQRARSPRQRAQALLVTARARHAEGDVAAARHILDEAMQLCRRHHLQPPLSVYAFLSVHAGEAAAAVRALETAPEAEEALATIYTPVHARFTHGYALATCGRAGDALRVLRHASQEAERRGLLRYTSLGANMAGWVLRNTGDVGQAQEANRQAREGARSAGYRELEVYAVLDPCDDDLAAGDTSSAARRIAEAESLMREPYAYRWRHQLRLALLRGRMALLDGNAGRAADIAAELAAAAQVRQALRYLALAHVLQARAGAYPVTAQALQSLSDSLTPVAALEAWWLLAELDSAAARSLAEQHRDRLAAQLDADDRARFLRHAADRLASISTVGRTG